MPNQLQMPTAERLSRNLGLLQAGATVTLDLVTPAGKKGKFRTCFIGYLPKDYVLIQSPEASKLGSFGQYMQPGANVTVRGLIEGHEGAIVAFVSQIRQTLQIPSRILTLEFPKNVTLQSLRSAVRIDTDIAIKVGADKEYWKANIVNISNSGCQVIIYNGDPLLMTNGQKIKLVVEDFRGLSNLNMEATVCNAKKAGNNVSLGLKFEEGSQEQAQKLLQQTMFEQS
ncbi:flagellar brake protein [Endozoicomonas sp. G2_1]|uniref:flagellar brake protein n=1 Tax=Endozoicomonas sp. G2_1 TaxID=2821091 RepID=UPI001ADB8BCC|nr:PilZ domain-containing protein [Endozoicomonas sp. G2_1]MBO9489466.1 flagellar brake protein [Endozoicomonas sp. G2_1]